MGQVTDPAILAQLNGGNAPPPAQGPIYGAPPAPKDPPAPKTTWKAPEMPATGPLAGGLVQTNSEGKVDVLVKPDNAKAPLSPEDAQAVRDEALTKLKLIKRLDKRSRQGYFTTGFGAETLREYGGTGAFDQKADVDTVANSGALMRILEMAKTNGGKNPLTPLSNADFQALSSSVSNLDTKQSDDNFQRNLLVYKDIFSRAYVAAGGDKRDVDAIFAEAEEDADTANGGVTPKGSAGGNPPENPFTGLPGKQQAEPDSIGEDPRFAGKRYNINGQEDPQGDFNAYGQYRDFAASQASPDGALQGTVTDWEGQPQESVENWTNWIDGQGRTRGPDGSVLSGWLGPGTNGSYEGALQQELKRQGRDDPESVENYAVRGATGASFSLFDELTGALAAAKAGVQGDDAALSYKLTRDLERARQQQNEKGQGWAGTGAEIAGSLLTGGLLGRANSLRGATTTGMKGGALYGYGSGQGLDNSLQRASIGGVAGAGLGYGLSKTGSKVGQGLNALSETSAGKAFTKLFSRAPGETDEIDNIANALDPAELVAAGKANKTRVMTSDAFPPTTTAGKTAREIGENIPWIGTAGERSAQQAERSAAVSRFAKEFEAEGGTVEGVAKSWMKTRSKQIETYTKAKNDVIDGINTPVPPVALRTTLRTIDTKIAEMQRANADAFGPVISKLSSFRDALSSGKTLRQVETNRRLLGDMFEDAGLAAVKGDGQKALNAIYKPLREDMGAFIKANGKPGDFNKWAGANKKLSGMTGTAETEAAEAGDALDALRGWLVEVLAEVLADVAERASGFMAAIPNVTNCAVVMRTGRQLRDGGERSGVHVAVLIDGEERTDDDLSGGMQSATELAVDLAVAEVVAARTGSFPGWMVFDEPFDGMTIMERETAMSLLRGFAERMGAVVFVVDHAAELKSAAEDGLFVKMVDKVATIRYLSDGLEV